MKQLRSKELLIASILTIAAGCSPDLPDPTIPFGNYSQTQKDQILKDYNGLSASQEKCGDEFLKNNQDTLFEYCEANNGGENVGGGCGHVAYAWSIHERVLELAMEKCKKP